MKHKILYDSESIDRISWMNFVMSHPEGNFFQTTQAFQFFNSLDNIEPIVLVAVEPDDRIIGLLCACIFRESNGLKGYFSRRCIGWGGPICGNMETALELLRNLNHLLLIEILQ